MIQKFNFLLVLAFSFSSLFFYSQEISISSGNQTTCGGFIVDSGLSAGDYGSNENFTMTVCPEAPETIINLDFFVFDLGAGDFMTLYDGNSTAAPLIGSYTSNELQGVDVTSSGGCITIQWASDGADNGNFTISLTCGIPCDAPIVIVENIQDAPILGCPGEEFTFDASASEFFNGATVDSFLWDFGDGTTNTSSWPIVTHVYDESGGYILELYITDSEGCTSTNFVSLITLIATEPIIDIIVETPVCVGSQSSYEVEANYEAVPWVQEYNGLDGGAIFIPDDQSQIFSSSIDVTGFGATEFIDEESDLASFFINFEHSYMGDLTIQFECPSGQIITVHQQGGGSTALGEPVDTDGDLTPGVGYDYWWAPTATNGTWSDEGAGTLPSGTYASVDSWENLYGCPLNGVWTVVIADSWASDNGYIFNWSVAFDPDLYPDLYNFTPNIGGGPDSTFWDVNPTVVDVSDDGNDLTLSFLEPGIFEYTYTLVDDFGCSYQESYEIEAIQGPIADAGNDIVLCQEDGMLEAEIIEGNAPYENGVWQWTPTDNMDNANSLTPTISGLDETTTYVLSIFPDNNPQCISIDSVTVTIMNIPNPGEDSAITFCPSDDVVDLFTIVGGEPDEGGIWLDVNDDPISGVFNPATDESTILYYSFPDCDVFSEFVVDVDYIDFNVSSDTTICQNGTAVLAVQITSPILDDVIFVWNNDLPNSNVNIVNPSANEIYTVHLEYGDACETPDQNIEVSFYAPLALEVTPQFLACFGEEIFLEETNSSGGLESYSYQWTAGEEVVGNTNELTIATSEDNSVFCLTLTDQCESDPVTACSEVEIEQLVNAAFTAINLEGCYPIMPTFTAVQQDYSDIQEESWSFGNGQSQTANNLNEISHEYTTPGYFTVTHTYTSNFGCTYEEIIPLLVNSYPYPEASFYVNDEVHIIPNTTFTYHNISVGNELNNWTFYNEDDEAIGTSTELEPVITYPLELSSYYTSLTVINEFGCANTTTRTVSVEDYAVFIPNAITPNNDGINEFFYVQGQNIDAANFNIKIFNRWGDLVFETDNIEEKWNGYNNVNVTTKTDGENLDITDKYYTQNDIYSYRIEVKSPASTDRDIVTGTVTVIR